ncbi:hypothetical protein [Streptomyces sp. NBC_00102]|uniref:hypothetical protein n=1 Tax=Streptomyces sp. NBC_00102 TaxID=2975652 RepID=UPI00224ED958|nr:hypothetical protein [Streptomyces sp. NBC_00102]MCX5398567.1 hypothetical protein [Streptomyces sp. NBC_00102]
MDDRIPPHTAPEATQETVRPRGRAHPWIWAALLVLVVAPLAIPVYFLGQLLLSTVTGEEFGKPTVSCDEAVRFLGAPLPGAAHDKRCQEENSWLDAGYDIRFRITRTALDDWLATAFPGIADPWYSTDLCDDGVDACGNLQFGDQPHGRALAADLTAVYGDDGTLLVHIHPFDV